MKRVTGIGGIFFQSESPEHLYEWYEKHLGIKREAHGQGATFEWRELQAPDGSEPGAKGATAWSIFPRSTKYFGASKAGFMVNYRVDDLERTPITDGLRGSWIPMETELNCGNRRRSNESALQGQ
jgi:hypothetical protein